MDNYSVTIKGQVEKSENENSVSVIKAEFGIVINNANNAISASLLAKDKLCAHLNISPLELFVTHIDIIPEDER